MNEFYNDLQEKYNELLDYKNIPEPALENKIRYVQVKIRLITEKRFTKDKSLEELKQLHILVLKFRQLINIIFEN